MGRLVETLVDKEIDAGNHRIEWNGINQASGVYFYELRVSGYT